MKRLAMLAALALAGCGGASSTTHTTSPTHTASPTHTSAPTDTNGPRDTTSPTDTATATATVHLSPTLHLSSSAFHPNGAIPRQYTCDGADTPPPLSWSGVPKGTHELLLTMRDPDAPTANFVHWAVAGIPPSATTVPSSGTAQGANSFGSTGYRGPCPPPGKSHHYVITLSALSGPSGLSAGFTTSATPKSAAVAIATLIGTYGRS